MWCSLSNKVNQSMSTSSRPLVEELNGFKDDMLLMEFLELDLCNSITGVFDGVIDEYGNVTAELITTITTDLSEDDILNMARHSKK